MAKVEMVGMEEMELMERMLQNTIGRLAVKTAEMEGVEVKEQMGKTEETEAIFELLFQQNTLILQTLLDLKIMAD